MTVKQLSLPELVDACLESGVARRGPVARAGPGVRRGGDGQAGPRRGPDRHHPLPRRLLHGDRPGRARARRWTTTVARSTRRRPWAPTPWSWSPAGCRPAPRTCTAPGSASPTRWPSWARTPQERGVRLAIEPLHPMYAADRCVVSTLAQALDLAERFPARAGRRRRRHVPRLVGRQRARADRPGGRGRPYPLLPARRLDHAAARGRAHRPRPDRRRLDRHAGVEAATWRRPATPGPIEVELFNDDLWARDGREVLTETARRFAQHTG